MSFAAVARRTRAEFAALLSPKSRPPTHPFHVQSVLEILGKTTEYFAGKGVENPRFNAEVILGHALGLKRMQLYMQFERFLTEAELARIRPLVRRRAAREPLSHVIGETEFYGLRIQCDARALIPRPETEELVEGILERFPDKAAVTSVLDLGTGTACIPLALSQSLPNASFLAVDLSADALTLAASNLSLHGMDSRIQLLQGSWFEPVPAASQFDLIVSNPPYLEESEATEALPEVREHEPWSALVAPEAGMADLRHIIQMAFPLLKPGALLALETGVAQHAHLLPCLERAGYVSVEGRSDLSGRERFLFGRHP